MFQSASKAISPQVSDMVYKSKKMTTFGKNYNIQGAFEEMMYTDKAYDSATGLYYFGARFYNSAIQRFLSEDSDTGSLNVPLSLNRYIYANDNPMSMNDATGHMAAYWSGNGIVSVPMVSRSPSDTSSFALAPSQPPPAPAPSSAQNPPRNYNYKNGNFMQGLNTRNSEVTNGGNDEGGSTPPSLSSPAKGPGFWSWFWTSPFEWGPFVINVAGDVASLIDPFVKGIFEGIASSIVSGGIRALEILGSAFGDLQNTVQLFLQDDLGGLINMAASFAWNLIQALATKANFWQKLAIAGSGIVIVGGDAASAGGMQAFLTTIGAFQLVTDVSLDLANALSTYNNIYPNG